VRKRETQTESRRLQFQFFDKKCVLWQRHVRHFHPLRNL
jgi:hypothetical protein